MTRAGKQSDCRCGWQSGARYRTLTLSIGRKSSKVQRSQGLSGQYTAQKFCRSKRRCEKSRRLGLGRLERVLMALHGQIPARRIGRGKVTAQGLNVHQDVRKGRTTR